MSKSYRKQWEDAEDDWRNDPLGDPLYAEYLKDRMEAEKNQHKPPTPEERAEGSRNLYVMVLIVILLGIGTFMCGGE